MSTYSTGTFPSSPVVQLATMKNLPSTVCSLMDNTSPDRRETKREGWNEVHRGGGGGGEKGERLREREREERRRKGRRVREWGKKTRITWARPSPSLFANYFGSAVSAK